MSKKKHFDEADPVLAQLPEEPASVTGQNGAHAEPVPEVAPVERQLRFAGPDPMQPQEGIEAVDTVKGLLTRAMAKLKEIPGQRSERAQNKLGETLGALR